MLVRIFSSVCVYVLKGKDLDNKEKIELKRLRVTMVTKALFIFIGIILMQLIAYMLCVLGYTVFGIAQGIGYARALAEITILNTTKSTNLMLTISAVSAILSFIWCAILYKKSGFRADSMDYRKVFSVKNIMMIFFTAAGCCIILTFLLSGLTALMPGVFKNYTKLMSNFETGNMAVTLAYAVFIGPVSEEMIFRGAIFDRFYIGFDYWVANILQAALFGLYHMNLVQGLYAFCLGIVLGVIVKATGSILCSMLTHIIFNGTSDILPIVLGSGNNIINIAVMFVLFVIAVLGIFGIKTFTGAVSHSN